MVFGNSTGRVAGNGSTSAGGSVHRSAPPSYVLGLDEVGNIKHEVKLGQTLGDIALIYGYTWEDISYMLEINGMTQEDIRLIQPGSVFLVPPKDGTFTPTSEAPSVTETATMTATREPRQELRRRPPQEEIRPATEPAALRDLRIGLPPDIRSTPTVSSAQAGEGSANAWVQVLAAANCRSGGDSVRRSLRTAAPIALAVRKADSQAPAGARNAQAFPAMGKCDLFSNFDDEFALHDRHLFNGVLLPFQQPPAE